MLWSHHLPCPLPRLRPQIKPGDLIPDMILPMYNNICHKVDPHRRWNQLNLVFIINRQDIHSQPLQSYTRIIIIPNLRLLPIQRLLCLLTLLIVRMVVRLTNNIEIQLNHTSITKIITTISILPTMNTLLNNITIPSPSLALLRFRLVHIQHLKGLRLKSIMDRFLVLVLLHLHLYLVPITAEVRIRQRLDHGNHITTTTRRRLHRLRLRRQLLRYPF